jgi:hypothetical protein
MALDRGRLLRPGVVSQFAPLLKAVSSLGALTGFHLQVYPVAALLRRMDKGQEGKGFKNGFC